MGHTKEPWAWEDNYDFQDHIGHKEQGLNADCENIEDGRIHLISNKTGKVVLVQWAQGADDSGLIISQADAQRIVAAVNGCEGINPEAVRGLLGACRALIDCQREKAPTAFNMRYDTAVQGAKAAIAKAEEG